MTLMTLMLHHALAYAEAGSPIFPVGANKRPRTQRGLNEATTDVMQIQRWWQMWPQAGIGLRTGEPSKVIVLDVDGDAGADALAELECSYERLPRTRSVCTPRGGQHYYFAHPGVPVHNSASKLGKGLDIRGDGGYVLVPPSHTIAGIYEWDCEADFAPLPEWMLALLVKREEEAEEATPIETWIAMLDGLVAHGARNDSLTRLAGHLLRKRVDYQVVRRLIHIVNCQRCVPPLPRDELERTLQSVHQIELHRRGIHDEPDPATPRPNPYQEHESSRAVRT